MAINGAPQVAEVDYRLGRALLSANRWTEALQAYQEAFARDPQGRLDRRELLSMLGHAEFTSLPEFWHAELIRFFEREDVDKSRYAMSGLRLLMTKHAFRAVRAAAEGRAGPGFEPDAVALDEVMGDQLFRLLLRDALIAQAEFERLLTRVRAAILLDRQLRARAPVEFLCALALQCFNNEFVFAEEQPESAAAAGLAREIEAALRGHRPLDDHIVRSTATLAMYRSLSVVANIETLLGKEPAPAAFAELLRRAVSEVAEERRLRPLVPVTGPVTDAVSRAVQVQYEENPYPRWLSFDRMPPISSADWLVREVPGLRWPGDFRAPFRMLVAGCGTGVETLGHATWIEDIRVTAVDLSLASLAYAQRMSHRLGVTNVESCQADILELGELPQRFDLIYCVGVLMALREPQAGLRALLRLLRPGGLLKLGLYSARARFAVNVAREIVRERRIAATPSEIREFRQEVFGADQGSPLRTLLRWRDFYSMSDCRDMLFHVQEHQFELSQIAAMLSDEGLAVLGLSRQLPRHALAAYRATYPQDEVTLDLAKWEAVEARFAETFLGMYQIWCRKASVP
jgi:SAM-dependent methyltransferase